MSRGSCFILQEIKKLVHVQGTRPTVKQEPQEGAGESEAAAPPVARQRQSAAQRRRARPRYYSSESSEDDEEEEEQSEEEDDAVRRIPVPCAVWASRLCKLMLYEASFSLASMLRSQSLQHPHA